MHNTVYCMLQGVCPNCPVHNTGHGMTPGVCPNGPVHNTGRGMTPGVCLNCLVHNTGRGMPLMMLRHICFVKLHTNTTISRIISATTSSLAIFITSLKIHIDKFHKPVMFLVDIDVK